MFRNPPASGFFFSQAGKKDMNRDQKAAVIEELAAQISGSEAIYATDYRGLTVSQAAALRARLRDADATFRIVKNTLTLRAADQAGSEQIQALIEGPTALTFVQGDPAIAAKALDTFSRQENVLELRSGLLGDMLLDADAVKQLARLPAREQLNAQFAGVVASPITGLVRGLGSMLAGLAIALGQIQGQKEAAAPAEPAPAAAAEPEAPDEPAAEETKPEPPAEAEAESQGEPQAEVEAKPESPAAPEGEPAAEAEEPQAAAEDSADSTEAESDKEAE
jgi:large subunit ribosomal protein L10